MLSDSGRSSQQPLKFKIPPRSDAYVTWSHRKIPAAPFRCPQHLKTMKPLGILEPDASLTFFSGGPRAKRPRVWPSEGTFRRDFHVDSESESTQEVAVVCWTSPLSPRRAVKQVSEKDPLECVSSTKNRQMICVYSIHVYCDYLLKAPHRIFIICCVSDAFLTFCPSPWCKAKLQLVQTRKKVVKRTHEWLTTSTKTAHFAN